MKRLKAIAALFTAGLLCLPVFAETAEPEQALSKAEQLVEMGKVIGYFFLVMAVIFSLLFITKKIGDKWGKR